MADPLQDSFQKGFLDFLSSSKELDGVLAKAQQTDSNPQTREALGQFLDLFRKVQGDLEKELPGGVDQMIADLRQGQKDLATHIAKAGELGEQLEAIQAHAHQAIEDGKARLAEVARAPKPPRPADLARERLAALAKRQGAGGPLPELKEGSVLQKHLMDMLQPKTEIRGSRAIALGNIWENWPSGQTEPDDPADENR